MDVVSNWASNHHGGMWRLSQRLLQVLYDLFHGQPSGLKALSLHLASEI